MSTVAARQSKALCSHAERSRAPANEVYFLLSRAVARSLVLHISARKPFHVTHLTFSKAKRKKNLFVFTSVRITLCAAVRHSKLAFVVAFAQLQCLSVAMSLPLDSSDFTFLLLHLVSVQHSPVRFLRIACWTSWLATICWRVSNCLLWLDCLFYLCPHTFE